MHAIRLHRPGTVRLNDLPTDADGGLSRAEGEARASELGKELSELEDLLFFAGQHSLLVVLQGMDTSGKDGTLRFILDHLNAISARVASFKVPTSEELARDFLWRCHAEVPGRGGITLFNRSHYEDVLVVKVHNLAPADAIERRYGHINAFESLLCDSDTLIVKLFLHISEEEQGKRLLAREGETEKAWKLNVGDWKERALWDDYQSAYEIALGRCSSESAPWYVIPADRKWFRNLAVAEILVETLRPFTQGWLAHLERVGEKARSELREFRSR